MKKRNPTIVDIARQVGVVPSTVSRILNSRGRASLYAPATVKKVQAAARDLHYVPNAMAENLRRGRTGLLALVLQWNVPELMDEIERQASALGYGLLVQFAPAPDLELELTSLRNAIKLQAEGIVWMPGGRGGARYEEIARPLRRIGRPLVFLQGRIPALPDAPMVEADYSAGYRDLLEHLAQQGYRRAVYFHEGFVDAGRRRHWKSFSEAAREVGLEVEAEIFSATAERLRSQRKKSARVRGTSAFVFEHDWPAVQAVLQAHELGLEIPREVGLCGIGDILLGGQYRVGEVMTPALTMLRRPFGDMALRAMETLERLLRPETQPPPAEILLPMTLSVRASTCRAR